MNMWLFMDESWSPDLYTPRFGVLFGVMIADEHLRTLDRLLYRVRRKYYGIAQARDLRLDLKGKDLLSNRVLALDRQPGEMSRNICVVRELLNYPFVSRNFAMHGFCSTVYSADSAKPDLLSPDPKRLARPFRHLVESASQATSEIDSKRVLKLIFDQRLGAQQGVAIAVKNFIDGIGLTNVHPIPYFAVSNACPGVQVADVFAHLVAKRIQQPARMMSLFRELMKLQWQSKQTHPRRFGFKRFDQQIIDGVRKFTLRDKW